MNCSTNDLPNTFSVRRLRSEEPSSEETVQPVECRCARATPWWVDQELGNPDRQREDWA